MRVKRIFTSAFAVLLMASLWVATSCTPTPAPPAKLHFHSVEVEAEEGVKNVVPLGGKLTLMFRVADADAFALSDYEASLHLKGGLNEPTEVAIESIVPAEQSGQYRLTIVPTGQSDYFALDVMLAFKGANGVLVRSNIFTLTSATASVSLSGFCFLRSLNPQLGGDVKMNFDAATTTLSGSTDNFVANMTLIPSFESEGEVYVGDQLQTSGVSAQDFSKEVVYTVVYDNARVDYKVRVSNFTGLPVMIINTADGRPITSKEDWKDATISIYGAGRFDDLAECAVEVKGRGNSTWGYDKKPYALKFPSKTSVLGMPKHKRWVLLANTMDRTMMRNRVAYHVAEQTSLAWTPRTEYAEVILNGKHIGNYLITEQIRIDKNRIDITEMEPTDISGEAITGGYVFEMDFHFDNVNQWWTPQGFPSSISFPDEDDIVPEQIEWAKNYFNEVERVIFDGGFADPETGYAAYIDPQSFVDYWLVYELCINHEIANPGSVYLHKDRGGKLTAGPIWDFDWGTFSYAASPAAQGKLFMTHAIWYRRLFQDEAFKALAKRRWKELYHKFVAIGDFILEEYDYLGESAKKNFAIWNPATTGNVNGDVYLSFDEAVERMHTIYTERVEHLNKVFYSW